ncbi:MAG: CDP-alcohol phosphatidyltransferase family protein [Actinomycetota bacterium]|nr:CDP-alcohol phosphatidyltransferase family protein [Actinomycetota bacterium]
MSAPELAPDAGAGTGAVPDAAGAGTGAVPDAAGASGNRATEEDRVVTLPNLVSTLRFLGVGVFLWLLFGAGQQTAAAVLLGVLGATDWVDGQLARRLHQVSRIGKMLDPAVDRVLVGTAVIAVIVHGAVPLWFGLLTVGREVLVSATVLVLAALGARRIDVLWIGKAGTFGLMVAYPGFLISDGTAGWQQPFHVAAWVFGGAGIVLAWAAAVAYLVPARRALAEGRAARQGAARQGAAPQGAAPQGAAPQGAAPQGDAV